MPQTPDHGYRPPARQDALAGRLPRLLGGYVAACLAAAVALPVGQLLHDAVVKGPSRALGSAGISDIFVIAIFAFGIALVVAAPFAVAFAMLAEARRIERPPAFAVFGLVTGLVVEGFANLFGMANPTRSDLAAYILFAVIGAIGGLVFWRVAVRRPPVRKR